MTPCERSPSRRAGARRGYADIDGDRARHLEIDDLPAIDIAGLAELRAPERRRLDIAHPAGDGRGAIGMGRLERRFGDRIVADAGRVHEGLVRQVHQIVEHQAIVAFDVNGLAVAFPFRIVVPVQVRHLGRVGERGIARPHPYETMLLDHREGTHAGRRIDGLLRRHEGAAAMRVENQPVIAAHHLVAAQLSLRERQQPMPAGVFQRHRTAVLPAIEHHLLVADRAGKQGAAKLMVPHRGVPGVQGKGSARRNVRHWRFSLIFLDAYVYNNSRMTAIIGLGNIKKCPISLNKQCPAQAPDAVRNAIYVYINSKKAADLPAAFCEIRPPRGCRSRPFWAPHTSKNTVSWSPCMWTSQRQTLPCFFASSVARRSAGTRLSTGSVAFAASPSK